MRRLLVILFATFLATSAAAHGDTGYEPCHLLCVLPSGRTGSRSSEAEPEAGKVTARFEVVSIEPQGRYERDKYVPLARGAQVTVVEFLPSLTYAPTPDWLVSGGWPWEYNKTTGVTLPTLHEVEGTHREVAGGGVWLAASHRFEPVAEGTRPWAGAGYRFSGPQGTVDVGDELEAHPDKAIEALGVGSDDLYGNVALELTGVSGDASRFWIGGEFRLHMLPRWQRLFATTSAYDLKFTQPMTEPLAASFRVSGFQTYIPSLNVLQSSLVIPAVGVIYTIGPSLSLDLATSTQLHGKRPMNQNSLRTVSLHFGTNISF